MSLWVTIPSMTILAVNLSIVRSALYIIFPPLGVSNGLDMGILGCGLLPLGAHTDSFRGVNPERFPITLAVRNRNMSLLCSCLRVFMVNEA